MSQRSRHLYSAPGFLTPMGFWTAFMSWAGKHITTHTLTHTNTPRGLQRWRTSFNKNRLEVQLKPLKKNPKKITFKKCVILEIISVYLTNSLPSRCCCTGDCMYIFWVSPYFLFAVRISVQEDHYDWFLNISKKSVMSFFGECGLETGKTYAPVIAHFIKTSVAAH